MRLCVAIVIAVSIAVSVGLDWAVFFVAVDLAYAWWRLKGPARAGRQQKGSKSSWSRTLR